MAIPVVAIVGRPNVGKSSLFNVLCGRRTSIVEATPGVTRDRVSAILDVDDVFFELVDTGGYGIEDRDDLTEHIERQIHYAIEQATLVLFVVDIRQGIVPLDVEMAELLRTRHDRVRLIANKTDTLQMAPQAAEFGRLGYGEPLCVSAAHGIGRRELQEEIAERVRQLDEPPPRDPVMKIALVGKRNTGKSTFVNSLAGQERVIVSEVAGTTRDAIDVRFEKDGRIFLAIDTAGVRKRTKLADDIEYFAFTRAQKSITRADVVLFLLDSTEPISHVDKRLGTLLVDEYKPVVLIVNKWDLAKDRASTEQYGDYLTKTLQGLDYAPVAFVSAKDNRNVYSAIDVASSLFKKFHTRVTTGRLNQILQTVLAERGPSAKRGSSRLRIYYAAQVSTAPPTIVLFVNRPNQFTPEYERYLTSRMQAMLPFDELPIRFVIRPRREFRWSSAES